MRHASFVLYRADAIFTIKIKHQIISVLYFYLHSAQIILSISGYEDALAPYFDNQATSSASWCLICGQAARL